MQPSSRCVDLVKQFEGLRLAAYRDSGGVPTIGYGHTANVHMGDLIGEDQAEAFLAADLAWAATAVSSKVGIRAQLTQEQFDALTSFEFNTGGLLGSTLVKLLNAGDVHAAADEFLRWDKIIINHTPVDDRGLLRRRTAERILFLGGAV